MVPGWRESLTSTYQWMTFNEALLRATNFGSGLVELGLAPGQFVCIYSQNRVEWILCEQVNWNSCNLYKFLKCTFGNYFLVIILKIIMGTEKPV